jgi:glycosyltransferase family protein
MNMELDKSKRKYTAKTKDILGGFKIASPDETIDKIVNDKCSIARFGDGEFDMICGVGMKYQKYNKELAMRLKEVLESNEKDLLIGINNVIDLEYSEKYNDFANNFWKKWLHDNKFKVLRLLSKNKQYYSSNITRFYIDYKDKSWVEDYVKNLRRVWDNQDVVIVEGEFSRLGVGNDLFDNMKSIQRIICPSEDAFEIYDKILGEILKIDKNKMIMLALGPTATVLAYDLYKAGYRAIDIGHVDIEYEWFLRKATEKIKIETKYVTEVKDGENNIQDIKDEKYEKEIIARIMN